MISTVAWHEFWFTVRKKSYYLVTLGMPLLVLGYVGVISLIVLLTVPGEINRLSKPVGVIDHTGMLTAAGAPFANAVVGEEFLIVKPKNKTDDSNDVTSTTPDLSQLAEDTDIADLIDKTIVLLDDVEAGR